MAVVVKGGGSVQWTVVEGGGGVGEVEETEAWTVVCESGVAAMASDNSDSTATGTAAATAAGEEEREEERRGEGEGERRRTRSGRRCLRRRDQGITDQQRVVTPSHRTAKGTAAAAAAVVAVAGQRAIPFPRRGQQHGEDDGRALLLLPPGCWGCVGAFCSRSPVLSCSRPRLSSLVRGAGCAAPRARRLFAVQRGHGS